MAIKIDHQASHGYQNLAALFSQIGHSSLRKQGSCYLVQFALQSQKDIALSNFGAVVIDWKLRWQPT